MAVTQHSKVQSIKERLEDYRDRDREIDNSIERIDNFQEKIQSLRSPELSGMPHARFATEDRLAGLMARKDEMEREVRNLIRFQETERKWIEGILCHIGKADERACIQMRYIDGESWPKVTTLLFGRKDDFNEKKDSYLRRTTNIHGRALQMMAEYIESGQA